MNNALRIVVRAVLAVPLAWVATAEAGPFLELVMGNDSLVAGNSALLFLPLLPLCFFVLGSFKPLSVPSPGPDM